MPLLFTLIVAGGVGIAQEPPSGLAEAAAVPLADNVLAEPKVVFEIRELSMGSPDWRGAMQAMLNPVDREEAAAAWAVDSDGLRRLLEICRADERSSIVQAPKMTAKLGEPVRMSNEETLHYVAGVKRVVGEGNEIGFQPEPAEVHDGVRVELTETRLKGSVLFAHVVVRSNTVVGMLTTQYGETVRPAGEDPGVVRTSFLSKLKHDGPESATLHATIQVPEVASRRIEGDWLIPSEGAMVVSMGPDSRAAVERKPKPGAKAGGIGLALGGKLPRRGYAERVICVTAVVRTTPAESVSADQQ